MLGRVIVPVFVNENEVVSELAFNPTSKEDYKLSVYDIAAIPASDALQHYRNNTNSQAYGILASTETECKIVGLPITPDPQEGNPHHCLLDFSVFTGQSGKSAKGERRDAAKKICDYAIKRGWQAK